MSRGVRGSTAEQTDIFKGQSGIKRAAACHTWEGKAMGQSYGTELWDRAMGQGYGTRLRGRAMGQRVMEHGYEAGQWRRAIGQGYEARLWGKAIGHRYKAPITRPASVIRETLHLARAAADWA